MKNEIRFTLESKQRPKLAQEIGNLLGTAPHYERVPSCAYDIAGYRLDKEGVLHIPDAEVSPSGKGIHIIGQCDITKLPVHFDDRRKKLVLDSEYYQKRSDIGLELYIGDITNRYGTFTGNTINSLSIADCTQAVLTTLDKEMRKSRKRSIVQSVMEIGQYLILSVIFVSRRTETSSSGFMIKVISVNMVPSLRRMLLFVL